MLSFVCLLFSLVVCLGVFLKKKMNSTGETLNVEYFHVSIALHFLMHDTDLSYFLQFLL